ETFADTTAFANVVTIIKALAAEDERIVEYLRVISTGKTVDGGERVETEFTEILAEKVDAAVFLENLKLKVWDKVAKLNWRPFDEAREYVRRLELQNRNEWNEYLRSPECPLDIPSGPEKVYKSDGWDGLGDWLGTYAVARHLRSYLPFHDAREFARKQKCGNREQWKAFAHSELCSNNIPANPQSTYKNTGWTTWQDWLGTRRDYLEARKFARSLRLGSYAEWVSYSKSGHLPDDIPAGPDKAYKRKGWVDWYDWLGTMKNSRRDFVEARIFARSLKLTQYNQWEEAYRAGRVPKDIPVQAHHAYKDEGWISWFDWLGYDKYKVRDFEQARIYARSLGFRYEKEWRAFCETDQRPVDIPLQPRRTYRDKGWISIADWLGSDQLPTREELCRPYEEAKDYVRSLNLSDKSEWAEFVRSGSLPDDIPKNPKSMYADKFEGFKVWLGTDKPFLPFHSARSFSRSLGLSNVDDWYEYKKSGKKPHNIPGKPNHVYRSEGWNGMKDWLGTDKKK
ncbi:MAG: hypothetical protein HN861_04330, partial [Rhodospirillaceae bacterium]|nr:hypothetical protein [Rhodospirillaceae bacterium]